MARLTATARFVRSIEDRKTSPRSSTSWTGSSLQEYQSTIRRRFSFVTASRSTPRFRSSSRTESGECEEMTMRPHAPVLRPSARKVSANRSFSWPGGPWRRTLEPSGRPPWTISSKPSTPVDCRGTYRRLRQWGAFELPLSRRRIVDSGVHKGAPGILRGDSCWRQARPPRCPHADQGRRLWLATRDLGAGAQPSNRPKPRRPAPPHEEHAQKNRENRDHGVVELRDVVEIRLRGRRLPVDATHRGPVRGVVWCPDD